MSLIQAATAQESTVPDDRKIIRNANLQIESDSPTDAQPKIEGIAQSYGGFVVESQQSMSDKRSGNRDIVAVTVRVSAEKFIPAVEDIRKAGTRVLNESIKGEDVTEEFIDVDARLKAKRHLSSSSWRS